MPDRAKIKDTKGKGSAVAAIDLGGSPAPEARGPNPVSRERFGYPFPLILLLPAVFLSGTAALVYEIVWARHLSLILGSTTGAVVAVLSSFMLGLALGAVLMGQRLKFIWSGGVIRRTFI